MVGSATAWRSIPGSISCFLVQQHTRESVIHACQEGVLVFVEDPVAGAVFLKKMAALLAETLGKFPVFLQLKYRLRNSDRVLGLDRDSAPGLTNASSGLARLIYGRHDGPSCSHIAKQFRRNDRIDDARGLVQYQHIRGSKHFRQQPPLLRGQKR